MAVAVRPVVKLDIEPGQSEDALNTIGRSLQYQAAARGLRFCDEHREHADAARVDACDRPEIQNDATMPSKQAPDAGSEATGRGAVDDGPAADGDGSIAIPVRVDFEILVHVLFRRVA